MIGVLLAERLTCGPGHLPGCYNPNSQDTYCICGEHRWQGQVGTGSDRAAVPRRGASPQGRAEPEPTITGWDTWAIETVQEVENNAPGDPAHVCEPAR